MVEPCVCLTDLSLRHTPSQPPTKWEPVALSWEQNGLGVNLTTNLLLRGVAQGVHLKHRLKETRFTLQKWKQKEIKPHVIYSPAFLFDTGVKVTLVSRPLLTPVVLKSYSC